MIESFRDQIGITLGSSRPVSIEQPRIDAFATTTGDAQWIHVDPERAERGPYNGTIAHGYLVLSLLPAMTRDVIDFGTATTINYGLDRVRFPNPVRHNDTLVDTITIDGFEPRGDGQLLALLHTITNSAGLVACAARTLTYLPPHVPRRVDGNLTPGS